MSDAANSSNSPTGKLSLQTIAMPGDTNASGDIFGGWVLSQMDLASAIHAGNLAKGRITTVAVSNMTFHKPVPVGAVVSCYTSLVKQGNTSMTILVEVWCSHFNEDTGYKVTDGEFVFVAIDSNGKPRPVTSS